MVIRILVRILVATPVAIFAGGCQKSAPPVAVTSGEAGESVPVASRELDMPPPGMPAEVNLVASTDETRVDDATQDSGTDDAAGASLVDLLLSEEDRQMLSQSGRADSLSIHAPEIDDEQVLRSGIRKLEGRYVTIYTDIPSRFAVDEIPRVFDAAVPLWCEYFGLPEEKVDGWKLTGYLMQSKERHRQVGLLPDNLPDFLHGFHRGLEFWAYDKESDYYRRHLVLHEGVHGFMSSMLGGTGPPWYREGMAELLATHRWKNHKLVVGYMPRSRDEVPYWGRIKIIKEEFAAGRGKMLREIMRYDQSAHLRLEPYAWCWAAAAFLDGHPVYRNRFRQLASKVTDTTAFFSRDLEAQFAGQMRELDEEWQLFVVNIDYGYDLVRNRVTYAPGIRKPGVDGRSFTVASDRGWQSTGMRMEAGKSYRINAQGRFQLRQQPDIWWCEPGGITLRYTNNRPIGMLMGNIRLDEPQPGLANLGNPIPIGLSRRIIAAGDGTLYLKINDHPGELADNLGQVMVKVVEDQGQPISPEVLDSPPGET